MRAIRCFLLLATVALLTVGALVQLAVCAAEPAKGSRILYDTKADGKEQIKAALVQASKDNKNVILKFGANWCGWCHKLSDTFKNHAEISKTLKENYVLV